MALAIVFDLYPLDLVLDKGQYLRGVDNVHDLFSAVAHLAPAVDTHIR